MDAATTKDRVYIDPPTIPAGMTVREYRQVRAEQRKPFIRRISSRAMVIGR